MKQIILAVIAAVISVAAICSLRETLGQIETLAEQPSSSVSPSQNPEQTELSTDLLKQFSAMIDPAFCNDLDSSISQFAVLIPGSIRINTDTVLSDTALMEIAERAIALSYPKKMLDSWRIESGFQIPLYAVEAVLNKVLLFYNIESLLTLKTYDSTTQTIYFDKDELTLLEVSVTTLDEPIIYAEATAKLLMENCNLEYHGETVYALSVEVKAEGYTFERHLQIVELEDGFRLATSMG